MTTLPFTWRWISRDIAAAASLDDPELDAVGLAPDASGRE
jgi:hypothetical protein